MEEILKKYNTSFSNPSFFPFCSLLSIKKKSSTFLLSPAWFFFHNGLKRDLTKTDWEGNMIFGFFDHTGGLNRSLSLFCANQSEFFTIFFSVWVWMFLFGREVNCSLGKFLLATCRKDVRSLLGSGNYKEKFQWGNIQFIIENEHWKFNSTCYLLVFSDFK